MTKDDFMKHVFEYKSDVYDNDYRGALTIISNMLDPLEDWQNKTGVKGMSFDMVVPLYNFKRVNETKNEIRATLNMGNDKIHINIDDEGKIDYSLPLSRADADRIHGVFSKETGDLSYTSGDRRQDLSLLTFASNFRYDRKQNQFCPDEGQGMKTGAKALCEIILLPLINEQLRTNEEKYFSRNGLDILKEVCEDIRNRQKINYVTPVLGALLDLTLVDTLGRPGDTTLTKQKILTGKGANRVNGIPKSTNALSLIMGCVVKKFCKLFPPEHISAMMSKPVLAQTEGLIRAGYFFPEQIFGNLFYSTVKDTILVENYLARCLKRGWKADITLGRNSSTAHDKVMVANDNNIAREMAEFPVDDAILKIKKPYRELAEKYLPDKYKLLTTKSEMILEGNKQRNCVASYVDKVNKGQCAIFSKESPHCTIEVNFENKTICFDNDRFNDDFFNDNGQNFNDFELDGMKKPADNIKEEYAFSCKQYYGYANSFPPEIKEEKKIFDQLLQEATEKYKKDHERKKPLSIEEQKKKIQERLAKKQEREDSIKMNKSRRRNAIIQQHNRYSDKRRM